MMMTTSHLLMLQPTTVVTGGDNDDRPPCAVDCGDDTPPANNTSFKKGDRVRVWFRHYLDWFVGIVERLMPASIEVFYPPSTTYPDDTYSIHRLRTTKIEHITPTGIQDVDAPRSTIVGGAIHLNGSHIAALHVLQSAI